MDNLSDLIYVNISNTSSESCPVNSENTPCVTCSEKCKLFFVDAFFQASCSTFNGGLQYSNITTNSTGYLTFNENTYTVLALYLLTPSINTYGNGLFCDFVIELRCDSGYLIIYIPVAVLKTTTITIPDISDSQSLASINFFSYMPSQKPFYYYNASYKGSNANYIIFPKTSCNASISQTDYDKICNANDICSKTNPSQNPNNNYFSLVKSGSLSNPIYYNATGANISAGNDYYMDCQIVDAEYVDEAGEALEADEVENTETTQSKQTSAVFYIIVIILSGLVVLMIYNLFVYFMKS